MDNINDWLAAAIERQHNYDRLQRWKKRLEDPDRIEELILKAIEGNQIQIMQSNDDTDIIIILQKRPEVIYNVHSGGLSCGTEYLYIDDDAKWQIKDLVSELYSQQEW